MKIELEDKPTYDWEYNFIVYNNQKEQFSSEEIDEYIEESIRGMKISLWQQATVHDDEGIYNSFFSLNKEFYEHKEGTVIKLTLKGYKVKE